MTLIDFAHKLVLASSRSAMMALISDFINEHSGTYNKDDIQKMVNGLREDQVTSFGGKLGFCRNYCLEESNNERNLDEKDYIEKLKKTSILLEVLSKIYQDAIEARKKETPNSNETALLQQKEVLREINSKIKTYKSEVDESRKEMQRISTSFNDKIFSVLINTVSLLGIFVTIAFAGFGVVTVFSNIDFGTALQSEEAFVKNIFYVLITSTLSYNLLLLLVYFIFRISRPILLCTKDDRANSVPFSQVVNLKPFVVIDVILASLTVATFVSSILVW